MALALGNEVDAARFCYGLLRGQICFVENTTMWYAIPNGFGY